MALRGEEKMLMEVKELHRSEKSVVTLAIDADTGVRYVRKELRGSHPIYQQLQTLPHPYLPQILQVDQHQDGITLLEEYIDGANLAEIKLPEKQAVALMEELCEVLVFLHSHGILHRDIKPSNLLLATDGHIRLIDFDAAREEKPNGDSDTQLLGTKGYAPPEQYGFAQTDARTDIYAVGVTMKQLLGKWAEKRPYRHILRKCTEFAPKRRYQTAGALLRALKTRAIQLWLPCLVAVAVLLIVGAFAWWYHSNQAEITEARYPDETLLFYAVTEDHLIANAGELRTTGQELTMHVDLDGDRKKELVRLYAADSGTIQCEVISGNQNADGSLCGKELLSFAAAEVPLADFLTSVTQDTLFENEVISDEVLPVTLSETLPDGRTASILTANPLSDITELSDELYVQLTCVDLNPEENDGKEIVVSVGDLSAESVSAVYSYTGGENAAAYRGRIWGGGNTKLTSDGYLESELLRNPYHDFNTYGYNSSTGITPYDEVDYEKYLFAVEGNLSLEEWNTALSS